MIRSELVQKISTRDSELTPYEAEKCVDTLLSCISTALANGKRVELRGFGVFTTRYRRDRIGRNPRSGKKIPVTAKVVPFFKSGKELRNKMNKDERASS
jgi:integration host factor subunit beta